MLIGREPDAALVFSRYLGGSADDVGTGIALKRAGAIYVVGTTNAADFPTRRTAHTTFGGGHDAFLMTISIGPQRS